MRTYLYGCIVCEILHYLVTAKEKNKAYCSGLAIELQFYCSKSSFILENIPV